MLHYDLGKYFMSQPLISIITINRNNADGLRKTMQSVLSQTFDNYEYIIIDGASTDSSVEVIKSFVEDPKNADKVGYWVSEPDRGIYNAMNKGISRASGEWTIFLNSGDCLINDEVLTKVSSHLRQEYDIVSGVQQYDYGGKFSGLEEYDTYTFILEYGFPHSSSFIRKILFEKYGYYDESYRIISDWMFFYITIVKNRVPFKIISEVVSLFDTTGISSVNSDAIQQEKIRFCESEFTHLENELFNKIRALQDSEEYKMGCYIKNSKFRFIYEILRKLGEFKNRKKKK